MVEHGKMWKIWNIQGWTWKRYLSVFHNASASNLCIDIDHVLLEKWKHHHQVCEACRKGASISSYCIDLYELRKCFGVMILQGPLLQYCRKIRVSTVKPCWRGSRSHRLVPKPEPRIAIGLPSDGKKFHEISMFGRFLCSFW